MAVKIWFVLVFGLQFLAGIDLAGFPFIGLLRLRPIEIPSFKMEIPKMDIREYKYNPSEFKFDHFQTNPQLDVNFAEIQHNIEYVRKLETTLKQKNKEYEERKNMQEQIQKDAQARAETLKKWSTKNSQTAYRLDRIMSEKDNSSLTVVSTKDDYSADILPTPASLVSTGEDYGADILEQAPFAAKLVKQSTDMTIEESTSAPSKDVVEIYSLLNKNFMELNTGRPYQIVESSTEIPADGENNDESFYLVAEGSSREAKVFLVLPVAYLVIAASIAI